MSSDKNMQTDTVSGKQASNVNAWVFGVLPRGLICIIQ